METGWVLVVTHWQATTTRRIHNRTQPTMLNCIAPGASLKLWVCCGSQDSLQNNGWQCRAVSVGLFSFDKTVSPKLRLSTLLAVSNGRWIVRLFSICSKQGYFLQPMYKNHSSEIWKKVDPTPHHNRHNSPLCRSNGWRDVGCAQTFEIQR